MTINTESTKRIYSGNGVATLFDYDFKIFTDADLLVTLIDDATAVETVQVLNTDYTVSGEGFEAGGKVSFAVAPASGKTVLIQSNVPYTQPADYKNQGRFFPETMENSLDRATRQILQVADGLDRSLTLPPYVTGVSTQLPVPESSKLIGWDAAASLLRNYGVDELATVAAYAQKVYQTFTGDGVTTTFMLNNDPVSLGNLDVSIDGVTQVPAADYTISGNNIIFSPAPSNGSVALVRYDLGLPAVSGEGEANTASNLGSGAGVFASKSGVDLRFKSIKAGANVTITQSGTEIEIAAAGGGGGGGGTWGSITGTLSAQTDLQAALNAKAASVHAHAISDVTGLSSALAAASAFQQAGTGATTRTMQDKARERLSLADFISAADLATAVSRSAEVEISTPLANAIAQATALGGAEIYIPAGSWKTTSTIIVDEPSIDIIGAGGDGNHDASSPNTGTTIRWRGADGGEIMRVQSKGLAGSPTISGGSLRNLKLSGGNVNTAAIGLLIASVRGWTFENITIYETTGRAVYVTVQPLGAEARDTQKCLFRHITVRMLLSVSASGVGFELAGDSGANASFNIFEHCDVLHQDGAGYKLVTADNNMFTQCRAFRPTGSGYGVEVHGNNTAGFESNSNTFYGLSPSAGGVKLFGTTTYTVPSKNTVFYVYDVANGASMPTVETGASWHMHKSSGATYRDYLVKPVIGVDDSQIDTHRAAVANESLRIYNFASDHMRLVDGAGNNWAFRVDGTTGNLEPVRNSGSGIFNVPGAAAVGGDLTLNSGNRIKLQGSGNLTGIRYSSPNVDIFVGAGYAAGFGTNTVGFCGTTPVAKPTVTGSKGGNAALASLLTALASMGLITDSST